MTKLVGHGGEQTRRGRDNLGTGVQQHETASAVGVLGLASRETGLAEEGGLLVAQVSSYRDASQGSASDTVYLTGCLDGWEHGVRNAQEPEDVGFPLQSLQIHQHSATGVGDIGDMHAALGPPAQIPNDPGINSPKEEFAFFSSGICAGHLVENPLDLGTGEVRC